MSHSLPDSASNLFTSLTSSYRIEAEIVDLPEKKWYRFFKSLLFWLSSPFLVVDILWKGVLEAEQVIQGPFEINEAHFQLVPLKGEDALEWYDGTLWTLVGEKIPDQLSESWTLGPYVSLHAQLFMMRWAPIEGKILLIAWDTMTNSVENVCALERCNWYLKAEDSHILLEYHENQKKISLRIFPS